MKLLVCGGAGFIGSAFIKNYLKKNPQDKIVNLDSLTIGSNQANLDSVKDYPNYSFIHDNICNSGTIEKETKDVDVIVNFAAESHVDRSISNPKPFIETNVVGTYTLLEAARKNDKQFIHVSTDEIYGEAEGKKSFTEDDLITPRNPYSATKASADHLVGAYNNTYGLNCIITRCTNNFGPYQFPEKLIPKTIIRAHRGLKIPLYGDGLQIRSWIYVIDHVEAIESLISKGKSGQIYNITAWDEIANKTIVEKILELMKKSTDLIEYVGDRPVHDKRYSINASTIEKETGWKQRYQFDQALSETVQWYQNNLKWWEPIADEKTLHPQTWLQDWK